MHQLRLKLALIGSEKDVHEQADKLKQSLLKYAIIFSIVVFFYTLLLVGGVLLGDHINLNGNGILICANLTISDLLVTACYFWVMRNLKKEMKKFCEETI